ncbi:hypothetical protein [Paenibacillus sp. MMO-58]|uniref:hypothetical protein n=1 Tax=Paenibacillus sp. MMO-58 TaxID=3081290 RepID=UPI00301A36A5
MGFPNQNNYYSKYDIVKFKLFPWYGYKNLDNYSFVFSTFELDEECAEVHIEIVHDSLLLAMNVNVIKASKHIYNGGNLKLNKFLEITENNTFNQIHYIALLKQQHSTRNRKYIGERRILLFVDNSKTERVHNLFTYFYARPFEESVQLQEQEIKYKAMMDVYLRYRSSELGKMLKIEIDNKKTQIDKLTEKYYEAIKPEYLEL